MRKISYSWQAQKFFLSLQPKQKKQIGSKIALLLENPHCAATAKLSGHNALYRMKAGECRIVYKENAEALSIEAISKRNDGEVYKAL